ncbi:MAG: hypothetical protein HQL49_03015 [Gammaproteobacteria bacterium]|nr:hypothetical protein [Gammaproteobacteria bacterium]
MNIYLILALLAAVATALLFWFAHQVGKKIHLILETEAVSIAFLQELQQSMQESVGAGSMHYFTEVNGSAISPAPLLSPLGQVACVYYQMKVSRRYEESYYSRDKEGNRTHHTRSGSDTISDESRFAPLEIEDASGRLTIDPQGAELRPLTTFDRFEPARAGAVLNIGDYQLTIPEQLKQGEQRTLGYHFHETAIPLQQTLYVMGEVNDRDGTLVLERSANKAHRFIISCETEEALLAAAQRQQQYLKIAAVVALLAAVILPFFA